MGVKQASRRWMYAGQQRNRLARLLNRVDATAAARGLAPRRLARLEVRGRRSGRQLSVPVVVTAYEAILRRYLQVSPGARAHFPVDRHDPVDAFEPIAGRYPVFRIHEDATRSVG